MSMDINGWILKQMEYYEAMKKNEALRADLSL